MITFITCFDHLILQLFANTDYKFLISIIQQKIFSLLDKLYHQKLYVNEECQCKHGLQILIEWANTFITYCYYFLDFIFSTLIWTTFLVYFTSFPFSFLSVHLYLFLMFWTSSRNSSAILRKIFFFNWIIEVNRITQFLSAKSLASSLVQNQLNLSLPKVFVKHSEEKRNRNIYIKYTWE